MIEIFKLQKKNFFLPETKMYELEKMYKSEKESKAKLRLQACTLRKKGHTLENISQITGYALTTVGDWLRRIQKNGLDGRYNEEKSGRPAWLTKSQKEELKKILNESPEKVGLEFKIWTTKVLAYFMEKKYDVIYKIRKIQTLVHELGFNFKKPRPEHYKANKKLQEVFKKTSLKKLSLISKMDGRSYFLTKVSSR